mgnify:FL=1
MPSTTPNLFIIGTPRSATTSVARWLSAHPDVAMGRRKEPMYHAHDLASPTRFTSEGAYLDLWSHAADALLRIDASPWYLYSKEAAASIAKMSPDSRLVVQLRNPVDMIASLHAHHVFTGHEKERDFAKAVFSLRSPDMSEFRNTVDYLEVARIAAQIDRYYEHFDRSQVVFVDFDEVKENPEASYLRLLADLGLRPVPLTTYPRLNPARRSRIPGMHRWFADARSPIGRALRRVVKKVAVTEGRPTLPPGQLLRVQQALQADIDELESLIGRDLTKWKGSPG